MIIITKGYLSVEKIMKINSFDYFLMCRPVKLDKDYIWTEFREIWGNLVKFSKLGNIRPLT